jgi:hypothetical protein
MSNWMKLSDMVWPEDHAVLDGASCVVVHMNSNGESYEPPCIARFDMNQGFFIAEDDIGLHAINPGASGGDVFFYILPDIEELKISIGELLS